MDVFGHTVSDDVVVKMLRATNSLSGKIEVSIAFSRHTVSVVTSFEIVEISVEGLVLFTGSTCGGYFQESDIQIIPISEIRTTGSVLKCILRKDTVSA